MAIILKTNMLQVSLDGDGYPSKWARSCDACCAVPCTLYCHTDSAYLCHSCDECIHAVNPLTLQHQCVWICTACENAPAAFTCQADAANLCINCDIEIHLANPLARCHIRVPIPSISGVVNTSSTGHLEELRRPLLDTEKEVVANKSIEELEEDETDSWLLLDLDNNDNCGFTYGEHVDECLDLLEYGSCTEFLCHDQTDQHQPSRVHQGDSGSDSAVPVQSFEAKDQQDHHHQQNSFADSGYEASKAASNGTSSSQKVPMSFTNAGYLLTTSNTPNSYSRFLSGKTDLLPNPSLLMPLQFTPMNREAKVLRYREKRKARKFEKKIRYATRRADAESRPRVKGRFARKADMEFEVDQMFATEDYG